MKKKDGKPFFSVIVPAHNSAKFIRKGLRSIKNQSFKDYELIVVCDACTDNTYDIAQAYADKIIRTDHGTDGLARNTGIDAADGEWILFMDDDDWWLHEFAFEQIHQCALEMEQDVDIIAFDFIWKDKCYWSNGRYKMNIAVWSKCWKKSFIGDDLRFPGIKLMSDSPFMTMALEKGPKICFMPFPMYYYNYMRKGSQTWQDEQERLNEVGK